MGVVLRFGDGTVGNHRNSPLWALPIRTRPGTKRFQGYGKRTRTHCAHVRVAHSCEMRTSEMIKVAARTEDV
jgi:hypothetical protein